MTALLLGLCTAMLIVWLARSHTAHVSRIDELPRRAVVVQAKPQRRLLQDLGGRVLALPLIRTASVSPELHWSVGAAVVMCPAVAVVSVRVAFVIAVLLVGVPTMRARRQSANRKRRIAQDMPMIIDLLHLAIQSGLTVGAALAYVAAAVESPVSDVYRRGLAQLDQGRRLAEVLEICEAELGDEALALTSALLSAERYGSPLSETLGQLVQETRLDQERRAEQAARRLSVQLLFPVAGCILPAFALLTAAPLLAGSVGTLASSIS